MPSELSKLTEMIRAPKPPAAHPMQSRRSGTVGKHFAYVKALDAKRISFIENRGQADRRVQFYARNGAKTLWLTRSGIVFDIMHAHRTDPASASGAQAPGAWPEPKSSAQPGLQRTVFSERLAGANPGLAMTPDQARPGIFNYFIGHERSDWHTGARSYALVTYRNAWKGVDMRLHGLKGNLEQVFVIKPGADPGRIRLALSGIKELSIGDDGALLIHTPLGVLRQERPLAYQTAAGKRKVVAARFELHGRNRVGFELAAYDHQRPLW
jgi:hypothetical protein